MKKYLILLLVLNFSVLLFIGNLYPQWVSQGILPHNLFQIKFVNENTGYSIGETGSIFKSINGGQNWISQSSGVNVNLWSSSFINENTGWIFGNNGTLLKTVNGGNNWNIIYNPTAGIYGIDICFLNANTGYMLIMGIPNSTTSIGKTTNGGINWSQAGSDWVSPKTFFFLNENTGWLSTSGYGTNYLRRTTNGGSNWVLLPGNIYFSEIFFINENTGFGTGNNGLLYKSIDGGINWNNLSSGTTNTISCIYFSDVNTGYAVGLSGTILKTTNSGSDWLLQGGAGITNLVSVSFINHYTGWIAGANVLILKTSNGGITYTNCNTHEISSDFILYQNYPNPFNISTKIKFEIPKTSNVRLTVYDIRGRETEIIVNENLNKGNYSVKWNASNYSGGVYFCKFETPGFYSIKRMILIK